ncbi:MAG: hypothetical protein IJV91_12135, partial [Kiritimatiellae bacterium]|nr:hypothetical protein [Kiritimatiellia bacterium]
LKTVTAYVEPLLGDANPGESFQFERTGYFCADAVDSKPGKPVFNRTVTLKDGYKPALHHGVFRNDKSDGKKEYKGNEDILKSRS